MRSCFEKSPKPWKVVGEALIVPREVLDSGGNLLALTRAGGSQQIPQPEIGVHLAHFGRLLRLRKVAAQTCYAWDRRKGSRRRKLLVFPTVL